MDVSHYHHEVSVTVDRPPEDVYAVVSDITRIGELSPICASAEWDDPARAGEEGAWFKGHNAIGDITWTTHCQVVVAQPGREFTFVNHGLEGKAELVRWGYRLELEGEGTRVTETWQVLPAYPGFVLDGDPNADVAARIDGMAALARDGMAETLANLKRVVESG